MNERKPLPGLHVRVWAWRQLPRRPRLPPWSTRAWRWHVRLCDAPGARAASHGMSNRAASSARRQRSEDELRRLVTRPFHPTHPARQVTGGPTRGGPRTRRGSPVDERTGRRAARRGKSRQPNVRHVRTALNLCHVSGGRSARFLVLTAYATLPSLQAHGASSTRTPAPAQTPALPSSPRPPHDVSDPQRPGVRPRAAAAVDATRALVGPAGQTGLPYGCRVVVARCCALHLGSGICCSPRHRVPSDLTNEG